MSNTNNISQKFDSEKYKSIVILFKQGDVDAFQTLYKLHSRQIHRYCIRILVDESAAKDALQDTFINAFNRHSDLVTDNFISWLYSIARHCCFGILRSKKQYEEFNEDIYVKHEKSSDFILINHINKAIESLPHLYREALLLREFEEYSYQEIAMIIGSDVSLAKIRVHRARLMLRCSLIPILEEHRHGF